MATQMELKVLFQAVSDTVHVTTFALRAPAGPAVLRVKMPLEVYLRAWIVTPFRGSHGHDRISLEYFLSFPFYSSFKILYFFVIYMSSKRPLGPPFWIVPWLLPSAFVRKDLNLLWEILPDS